MTTTKTSRNRLIVFGSVCTACLLFLPLPAAGQTIWIRGGDATHLSGPIALGQKIGIVEDGALGDFLVSTVCVTNDKLTGGYAEYQVTIPKSATYYVWARLRYPTGGDQSFAFIARGQEPTTDSRWAIGNSGIGVRQWHWDSQGTGADCKPGTGRLRVKLPAGKMNFRVYAREATDTVFAPHNWRMARPMFNPRLNVLCLSADPDYVPGDADARRALKLEPARVDEDDLRAESAPLPEVSSEELRQRGKKRTPDWLRCPRFYTKDCWRSELDFRRSGDIAFMVRQIAANEGTAFRMAVYWGGDAFFQSKVARHAPGLGKLDYLREAVDQGQRVGVKIVMYMNPNSLYEDHPLFEDAILRRADGRRWDGDSYGIRGSAYACINNPKYRRLLADVLTEAFTEYGPAGLYVDGLTPHRCFCEHCRAKYQEMFNRPMPVEKLDKGRQWCVLWEMVSQPELVGDPKDPDSERYTQFLYQSLIEVTRLISTTVKRCKPDAVTLYHSWPKPETIEYYDGTLTEIYVRRPWRHSLWKFGELANYSNIFGIPVLFNIYLHDHGTQSEARTKMIQGLAGGCYPNCWNLLSMRPVFRFVRENAECFDFARSSPAKFVALPRGVRDDSAQSRLKADKTSPARPTGDRFLAPYVGLYSAITRQGLPSVSMQLTDFHKRLDGFRVLCLANQACLSDEQVESIRRFVSDGGGLVATHETSLYDEKGNRRSDFALADLFGAHYVGTLPTAARQIRFETSHPVTEGLNDTEPLVHNEPHIATEPDGGVSLGQVVGPDTRGKPVPAVVVNQYGSGRVVYVGGRLDAIQCDSPTAAIERLFAGAVRWAAGGHAPVDVKAPAPIAVTLFDQPDRRVLHLVSLNGDTQYKHDRIEPIENVGVELEVPSGRRVKQLRRLWDKADVPFQANGNRIAFKLDRIGEYEVVAVELETP